MSSDTKSIIATIVATAVGLAGLLLTLNGGTNRRIDDVHRRIGDLNDSVNRQIGDLNDSVNRQIGNLNDSVNRRLGNLNDSIDRLPGQFQAIDERLRHVEVDCRGDEAPAARHRAGGPAGAVTQPAARQAGLAADPRQAAAFAARCADPARRLAAGA